MQENSLKRKEIKEFIEIGQQKKDKIETETKPILFDGRQFSVKFPKKFMDAIKYKEGDSIKFKLIKPLDINKKPRIELEYKRNGIEKD
jgi:hypothetical protein